MDYRSNYGSAVAELRRRLVQGDGRDVVVHASHPLDLHVGTATREEHATDTRTLSTPPPKLDKYIG